MSRTARRATRRTSVAALALLALPLTACDAPLLGGGPPEPVARIDAVSGNTTQIQLDGGFVDALGTLGLTPGVTGRARLVEGKVVFPITGGNVTVFEPGEVSPYVIGQLQHIGSGLSLTAGGTTVRLSDFNVDPGVSRVYGDVAVDGETVARSAFLLQLDGRTLEPLETTDRTAVLQGTQVRLSPIAARLLRETYQTDAVPDDLLIGVARIAVKLPRAMRPSAT